jgi:hypothetical protein
MRNAKIYIDDKERLCAANLSLSYLAASPTSLAKELRRLQ